MATPYGFYSGYGHGSHGPYNNGAYSYDPNTGLYHDPVSNTYYDPTTGARYRARYPNSSSMPSRGHSSSSSSTIPITASPRVGQIDLDDNEMWKRLITLIPASLGVSGALYNPMGIQQEVAGGIAVAIATVGGIYAWPALKEIYTRSVERISEFHSRQHNNGNANIAHVWGVTVGGVVALTSGSLVLAGIGALATGTALNYFLSTPSVEPENFVSPEICLSLRQAKQATVSSNPRSWTSLVDRSSGTAAPTATTQTELITTKCNYELMEIMWKALCVSKPVYNAQIQQSSVLDVLTPLGRKLYDTPIRELNRCVFLDDPNVDFPRVLKHLRNDLHWGVADGSCRYNEQ